jgi:PAS domain-containing protein
MLRQIVSKVQREIIVEKDLLANSRQAWQTKLTECQQQIEVLCEQVALTTAVLNTVDALVVVFDAEGYIVRCNCAWEQTTGYKFDQVRNQPFWELFFTLPGSDLGNQARSRASRVSNQISVAMVP